jgi:hypothetical protein
MAFKSPELKNHRKLQPDSMKNRLIEKNFMKKGVMFLFLLVWVSYSYGQKTAFPTDPQNAKFILSDIPNFWRAFDAIGKTKENPFHEYVNQGSIGLKGFIPYRIMGADSLLKMVERRKADYQKVRNIDSLIKAKEKLIKPYFYALEYWYPDAVYPPTYFVMGRFNSGGTVSKDGLLIGAEMLISLDHLPELIIHESIHFQQTYPKGETTLLQQSIIEGAADFVAELVTGIKGNMEANTYGATNRIALSKEFVERMHKTDSQDWLYGTSGKDERPNDLGYWMGYEIVKAYFERQDDKRKAVSDILNIEDYDAFLNATGYLDEYLPK